MAVLVMSLEQIRRIVSETYMGLTAVGDLTKSVVAVVARWFFRPAGMLFANMLLMMMVKVVVMSCGRSCLMWSFLSPVIPALADLSLLSCLSICFCVKVV